ncbi:hypothetical protein QAD02_006896 [Eretmocerus hayati]|uniref:Uncharacterized protein n=1 Tax=Eretmocerus hayati TaxID=131215 RepID=A0ACC2N2E5_9HYME|nr:hypothetical protein QAD02_006896 [Eretmocerus hayati]
MMLTLVILGLTIAVFSADGAARLALSQDRDGRIFGGRNATIEEYPYQVAIFYGGFICGGSIIDAKHVLTAAHCVPDELFVKYLTVRAGSSFKDYGGSLHHVEAAIKHENFTFNASNDPVYDVAVLKLNESVRFDKSRQRIELFESGEPVLAGSKASISGWGKTAQGIPAQLQVVEVPVITRELCDYAYRNRGGIDDGQICAALYGQGEKDACAGDSGGPLAIDGRLAGIVSYGQGCAESRFPGVYADVSYFRSWIDFAVDQLS